jgi:hypothetical protein
VVVLIVMGGAIVFFGAVLLLGGGRERAPSGLVGVLGLDVGPASAALLVAVGVAMVGLGAYPLAAPWPGSVAIVEASTPDAVPVVPVARQTPTAPTVPPADG